MSNSELTLFLDGLIEASKDLAAELDSLRSRLSQVEDLSEGRLDAIKALLVTLRHSDEERASLVAEARRLVRDDAAQRPPEDYARVEPESYIWPEGVDGSESGLGVLDAMASDMSNLADPWQELAIQDFRGQGKPQPLDELQRPDVSLPAAELAPVAFSSPPEPLQPAVAPELGHLLIDLVGDAPSGSGEVNSTPAIRPWEPPQVPMSAKAVLRVKDALQMAFCQAVSLDAVAIQTEPALPQGSHAHIFFELPTGAQIGVNCQAEGALDGGESAVLRFLDLTPECRDRLREFLA